MNSPLSTSTSTRRWLKPSATALLITSLLLVVLMSLSSPASADHDSSSDTAKEKRSLIASYFLDKSHKSQDNGDYAHPLDPLVTQEYTDTVDILTNAGYVDGNTLYPYISLHEPSKATVLEWQAAKDSGQPLPAVDRRSFAIVKKGTETYEAVVNLTQRTVESWTHKPGVQPNVLFEEFVGAMDTALSNPDFQQALADRGITDYENVFCAPLTQGYYGAEEQFPGVRKLKVPCFYVGNSTNLFTRPIEGLFAVVDLDEDKVLKIYDTGKRPLPPNKYEFLNDTGGSTTNNLPEDFTLEGNVIKWDNWSFHYRIDKRNGLVISLARYKDGTEKRSVLYQGALSEIFVPYMDPDVGWYYRTFLDAGEYGFGLLATPIKLGVDCPSDAVLLGGVIGGDHGYAYETGNIVCVFERSTGDPLWRHYEYGIGYAGKANTELVVRMISTIGNYDYSNDWVFTPDGRIRVRMGATGIDIVKGVHTTHMDDATAGEDTAYGTLVGPNIVAPNHDHFFNFRLDVDVDGRNNSFENAKAVQTLIDDPNIPRKSIWTLKETTLQTESDAKLNLDPLYTNGWHVVNPNKHGSLGHHHGYTVLPITVPPQAIMTDDDWPQKRAGFSNYNLWVTTYKPDELFAAGTYANQSTEAYGLPKWSGTESIVNTDIVAWYTMGLRHNPHLEDWPVMPTIWSEFELKPENFFEGTPNMP